jgi:hypothetical protein
MKQLKLQISPLLIAAILCTGCASILPGNDPVVVNAERVTTVAADTFDTFLKTEYDSRASLKAVSPSTYAAVHSYAEFLRAPDANGVPRAKQYLQSARALTAAYKANRTAENKANLQTILATISAALTETQKYLGQVAAHAGP